MHRSLIFDVRRYAINDGPGIRVTVFFKGCNLRCAWCHNPESQSFDAQLLYIRNRCIACGSCLPACPYEALSLETDWITIDQKSCTACGECTHVCPTKALERSGYGLEVDALMGLLEEELLFIESSGGGVTFSGGEPMLHADRLVQLLQACGERGFHRAVDTAGNVSSETLLRVASHTDLFLYDMKMMDSRLHHDWTGVGNELILKNLRLLSEHRLPLIIRIPLMGGLNDTDDNIHLTADFLVSLPHPPQRIQLLPYHAIAAAKFERMGKAADFKRFAEPTADSISRVIEIFTSRKLQAEKG